MPQGECLAPVVCAAAEGQDSSAEWGAARHDTSLAPDQPVDGYQVCCRARPVVEAPP
jgi:hypothetical protein